MGCSYYLMFLLFIFIFKTYGSQLRTVGGADAEDGAFPYMVSIRQRSEHICGGSIIEDNWILTAAHCYIEGGTHHDFTITVGTNLLNLDGDTYRIKKFIVHELYNYSLNTFNDIALIELQDHIKMKQAVQKIELPIEDTLGETKLVFSGWGYIAYPGKTPNKLQTINLTAISNDQCAAEYVDLNLDGVIQPGNICTLTKFGEGICFGDSGGPLVGSGKQVGIASGVIPCAVGKPDVFTRVYKYLDWIKDHIRNK